MKIASLSELLPRNFGINQPGDRDECRPDWTEPAGCHPSVMNSQADPQARLAICKVDSGDAGSELARVVGDQRQPVNALRQHCKLPVPARLAVPACAIQPDVRSCLGHRTLEIILGLRLFCCMALAESFDVYRYEKSERQAIKGQRMYLSSGWDARPQPCHDVTPPLRESFRHPRATN